MKKIRRLIIVLVLLLGGCAAQAESLPTDVEVPVLEFSIPAETELVTEATIPVRECMEGTQAASATDPTKPEPTEPENAKLVQPEPPAAQPIVTEPPAAEPPVAEPPASEPVATTPSESLPSEPQSTEAQAPETAPPETEPSASGDIYSAQEAMAVGNDYAVSAYGMCVDGSLGFGNASYEFADTAYVSGLNQLGGQACLNQMVKTKVDSLVSNLLGAYGGDFPIAGTRVNCYVEYDPEDNLYWIYVFYG